MLHDTAAFKITGINRAYTTALPSFPPRSSLVVGTWPVDGVPPKQGSIIRHTTCGAVSFGRLYGAAVKATETGRRHQSAHFPRVRVEALTPFSSSGNNDDAVLYRNTAGAGTHGAPMGAWEVSAD